MTISDKEDAISLRNEPIVENMLKFFRTEQFRTVFTLSFVGHHLHTKGEAGNTLSNLYPYRQLVRSLMHLSNTAHLNMILV